MKIEELIKTTDSFIPELYKAMKREIALKQSSSSFENPLISHIRDMEIAVDFVLVDLGVSVKAVSQVMGAYEGRFHTKNLLAVLSEGYKLVYGFGNRRNKSIWGCLKKDISRFNGGKKLVTYNEISSRLNDYGESHLDQDLRNLTLHYDDDMMKVYNKTVIIYSIDNACRNAIDFFDILKRMMEFGLDIYNEIGIVHHILLDINKLKFPTYPLDNERLHDVFKKVIDKDGRLQEGLKNFLSTKAGKSLDIVAGTCKSIERIKDKIKEFKFGNDIAELKNMYVLGNLQMLIQFMELDLACVLYSWLVSTSEVEGVMILRRITIIKVAVLSHLVGYEEDEKQRSIWSFIKAMIPANNKAIFNEAEQIERDFSKLVDSENDRKERNVYVHYIVGSKQIKLASIADSIENLDFFKTIKDMEQMVLLYPKLLKFSKNVMDALGEQVHRQSLESTNALLEQNNKNRELVQSSEMDEKDKQELLASIDKMDDFIRDPLKNKDWLTDFSTVSE